MSNAPNWQSMYWDAGPEVLGGLAPQRCENAKIRFQCVNGGPTAIDFTALTTLDPTLFAELCQILVLADGVLIATCLISPLNTLVPFHVPIPGGTSVVEIINPSQSNIGFGTTMQLSADPNFLRFLPPVRPEVRMVVYGDSIAGGTGSGIEYALHEWQVQLLQSLPPTPTVRASNEAWGGRTLASDFAISPTFAPLRARIAAELDGTTRNDVVLAIGTNDWIVGWSAATFGAHLTILVNGILADNASKPGLHVWIPCVTPLSIQNIPNGAGEVLSVFQAEQQNVATATGVGFIDLSTVYPIAPLGPPNGLSGDGIHPTIQGFGLIAAAIQAVIALP